MAIAFPLTIAGIWHYVNWWAAILGLIVLLPVANTIIAEVDAAEKKR